MTFPRIVTPLYEHNLFGKPVPTFPDHALAPNKPGRVALVCRIVSLRAQNAVAPHHGRIDGAAVFYHHLQRSYSAARIIKAVHLIAGFMHGGAGSTCTNLKWGRVRLRAEYC